MTPFQALPPGGGEVDITKVTSPVSEALINTRDHDSYSTAATVKVTSGRHRITVTVGLGPNPRVAEEILSSIRPTG